MDKNGKPGRKLTLNRETIRNLSDSDLSKVGGGGGHGGGGGGSNSCTIIALCQSAAVCQSGVCTSAVCV